MPTIASERRRGRHEVISLKAYSTAKVYDVFFFFVGQVASIFEYAAAATGDSSSDVTYIVGRRLR